MKIIPKYITTTIIGSILLVLLILMGLEILISFIGQLGKIGRGNYGLLQAMVYVVLDMPYQLYNFFPMASLIGSLLGLGLLANQSELIVMQASGFSKGQITATVLKAALMMVLVAIVLGEIVAPFTERYANLEQAMALGGGQAIKSGQGAWLREDNTFINIQHIMSRHYLTNITSYEFNQSHQLVKTWSASSAIYSKGQWVLNDIQTTLISSDHISSNALPQQIWAIQIDPALLKISDIEPDNMSLFKLNAYIDYLKTNGLGADLYKMNFWKRIFQPFATAVMICLAIPFVFGSLRTVTVGVRILTGVTIGFMFYILNQFFAPISLLYQVPALIGASLPTILFTIGAGIAVAVRKQ